MYMCIANECISKYVSILYFQNHDPHKNVHINENTYQNHDDNSKTSAATDSKLW